MPDHDPQFETNEPLAERLMAIGSALADYSSIAGGVPYTVIPNNWQVEDLEHLLPAPKRKRGTIKVADQESFVAMIDVHRTASTTVYAQMSPPKFVAVIDDHGDWPGWREHRIVWNAELSSEWKTWAGANKRAMKQVEFAQFIEDNLPDIIEPPGADMLEVSRTLEAKKKVNFASGIRLSNGQTELVYEEEIQGTAAKGKLQIPEAFVIAIPALEGGPRYRISARLRYRIDGAALFMWFDLERPHKVLEDAVAVARQAIADETGVMVVNGEA